MKKIIAISAALLVHATITPRTNQEKPREQAETSSARKISVSPDAERLIAEIARVSNPGNQKNPDYVRLIKYCIKHGHWSVFEQAFMTIEVGTSVAIATQLLRHRSFTFQQFSQRYADTTTLAPAAIAYKLRRQDTKNRQNSIDDIDPKLQEQLQERIAEHNAQGMKLYQQMLEEGVAKECARMVLPQATATRMYVSGNVRSWIHYIQARTNPDTQAEHREVAEKCKQIFIQEFPIIAEALGWTQPQKPE